MKEIISHDEIKYIKHRIGPKFKRLVDSFPVAVLTGKRRVKVAKAETTAEVAP